MLVLTGPAIEDSGRYVGTAEVASAIGARKASYRGRIFGPGFDVKTQGEYLSWRTYRGYVPVNPGSPDRVARLRRGIPQRRQSRGSASACPASPSPRADKPAGPTRDDAAVVVTRTTEFRTAELQSATQRSDEYCIRGVSESCFWERCDVVSAECSFSRLRKGVCR